MLTHIPSPQLTAQKVKMSQQSRSSSVSSEESMEPFLAFIEKALLKCPSPPPDAATAATTTTTNEGPVLDSQSTTADKFEALSAAVMLQREDLHHLLRDAQGKAPEEEKPTSSATAPGPDQGELVDKLKAEIKQLRNALNVAQWQLREAGRVQTEAPNTFEATMTEVIDAVNDKWEDYNSLSSVTDPAKVIEDLRKRNKELEEENKNLDRNGFMPKRMHDLVNKVKALRERNSELKDKLKKNEMAKADVDKIAELEAEITKITREKAELFSKQKSIFHLCKVLKENQGHKGDLPEYKLNDMVFNMFEDFLMQKIAQYK